MDFKKIYEESKTKENKLKEETSFNDENDVECDVGTTKFKNQVPDTEI